MAETKHFLIGWAIGAIGVGVGMTVGDVMVAKKKPPEPWLACYSSEPIVLPEGQIDGERWNQIVREHMAQGKCMNIRGAGRDKTIVEPK